MGKEIHQAQQELLHLSASKSKHYKRLSSLGMGWDRDPELSELSSIRSGRTSPSPATPPTLPTPHPAFPRRHPHLWPTGGTPQSTCQSSGRLPPTNCLLLPSDVHQLWTVLATTPLPVPALSFDQQSRRTGQ